MYAIVYAIVYRYIVGDSLDFILEKIYETHCF